MHYFAGLFDAEGYVSLLKTGNYLIGTEMTNEEVPNLLKETFGGNIYQRKRDNRKKTFTWIIGTNRDQAINFIEKVSPFSIVKRNQLITLKSYITTSKSLRNKEETRHILSCLKIPKKFSKDEFPGESMWVPNITFFEWFAGMMDGDGNFSLYETPKGQWKGFQSWVGVFNIHAELIIYVKDRLHGSISQYTQNKNPVWKWVSSQTIEQSVCQSLLPFLRIKKEACRIILDYHEIKKTKTRFVSYSPEDQEKIRDLIRQIKHINSL